MEQTNESSKYMATAAKNKKMKRMMRGVGKDGGTSSLLQQDVDLSASICCLVVVVLLVLFVVCCFLLYMYCPRIQAHRQMNSCNIL